MDDDYELEEPVAKPAAGGNAGTDRAEQIRAQAADELLQKVRKPTGLEPKQPQPPRRWPVGGVLLFPWYLTTLSTWMFMVFGLTATALAVTMCYHFLTIDVTLGRILGLPAGCIAAAALAYASASYLAVIEGTSEGYDTIEDWPDENWRDWFWTLPSTLGMVAIACAAGYLALKFDPSDSWLPLLAVVLLLYPVLQLSTLETGKISQPLSLPILKTLVNHPGAWALFYVATGALMAGFFATMNAVWTDPPYVTIAVMGPVFATVVLHYGRLLGRLAWWCSSREKRRKSKAKANERLSGRFT